MYLKNVTKEQILNSLQNSYSLRECMELLIGKKVKNQERLKKLCLKYGINWKDELKKKDNKRYCKYCGKELVLTKNNRKQFCNQSCAAKYNNRGKKHSEETKIKISKSLQRRNPNFNGEYKEREEKQRLNYLLFIKEKEYFCLNCGKKIETPRPSSANKYCCSKCQKEYQYKQYIERWKNGEVNGLNGEYYLSKHIRTYLFKKNENKCEKCGWGEVNPYTNRVPLQIHHIDGNCQNNREENLQLLCPNCHALTENFGSRNRNATEGRTAYFKKDK